MKAVFIRVELFDNLVNKLQEYSISIFFPAIFKVLFTSQLCLDLLPNLFLVTLKIIALFYWLRRNFLTFVTSLIFITCTAFLAWMTWTIFLLFCLYYNSWPLWPFEDNVTINNLTSVAFKSHLLVKTSDVFVKPLSINIFVARLMSISILCKAAIYLYFFCKISTY